MGSSLIQEHPLTGELFHCFARLGGIGISSCQPCKKSCEENGCPGLCGITISGHRERVVRLVRGSVWAEPRSALLATVLVYTSTMHNVYRSSRGLITMNVFCSSFIYISSIFRSIVVQQCVLYALYSELCMFISFLTASIESSKIDFK